MTLPNVSSGQPHVAAHNAERAAINALEQEVDTKISLPSNPNVGSLLRFDGTQWVKSATRLFEGNGSPEGVVAAPIGSRYVQLDAAGGALEYIKKTGADTSNTGWVLSAFADTGWRNVLAQVSAGGSAEKFVANIRRYGNVVDAYFDLQTPAANGNWDFYTLPLGFRPDFSRYGGLADNKENAITSSFVSVSGLCRLTTIKGSWRDRYNGSWLTSDPFPTTLPGSAL